MVHKRGAKIQDFHVSLLPSSCCLDFLKKPEINEQPNLIDISNLRISAIEVCNQRAYWISLCLDIKAQSTTVFKMNSEPSAVFMWHL